MRFISLITTSPQVSYMQDSEDFEVVSSWIKSGCNFAILISATKRESLCKVFAQQRLSKGRQ